MEQAYWLDRTRASGALARAASCSKSRLVHFDLAGRYSVKAADSAGAQTIIVEPANAIHVAMPRAENASYYSRLEEGARFLASRSAGDTERNRHLSMANHYVKLRLAAEEGPLDRDNTVSNST